MRLLTKERGRKEGGVRRRGGEGGREGERARERERGWKEGSKPLYKFARAKSIPRIAGLTTEINFLSFGGWKSMIKVSVGLVLFWAIREDPVPGLHTKVTSLCLHVVFPLCVCVLILSSYKDIILD